MDTLSLASGAQGLRALLSRAVGLDAQALVRLRKHDDSVIEAFVTTPFEVVASRRCGGQVSRDGAVVRAADILQAPDTSELGPGLDASWPGALPPSTGFTLLDVLPAAVVRELADAGQSLARQFSGPLGPPASLLNQTVLTVTGEQGEAEIPMRMVFALNALGLTPGFSAPMDIPRQLRVSVCGRWIRVDAPYGTVYRSTRLGLF